MNRIEFDDATLDDLAGRVAERVAERMEARRSPWLNAPEAAD